MGRKKDERVGLGQGRAGQGRTVKHRTVVLEGTAVIFKDFTVLLQGLLYRLAQGVQIYLESSAHGKRLTRGH